MESGRPHLEDLHVTLASGPGWKSVRSRVKAGDFEEPEFKLDIEPTFKVLEKGGKKSWYVRMKGQQDWKEYVMDLLQGGYDKGRVYHISIANLTGKIGDSIAMVEDRDYKDEYKKFQSSKKMKKYRAELNRYNRQKGTYGNHDKKDASHRSGRIVGFEDEAKEGFSSDFDTNGLEWEHFSPNAQDQKIVEMYGEPSIQT